MILQILQYDMWDKTPTDLWDWAALKEKIAKLVTTCMIHNFSKSVEDLEIKLTWENVLMHHLIIVTKNNTLSIQEYYKKLYDFCSVHALHFYKCCNLK